jgi:hypothetical protein
MKKFVENNKEKLRNIYNENYEINGDGLLFINYNDQQVFFIPEDLLENFCKNNKIIEFSQAQGLLGKKFNIISFNDTYTDVIMGT